MQPQRRHATVDTIASWIVGGRFAPGDTVIAEGQPIPYCTFGVTQRVDDGLAQKVKKALLNLKKDDTVEVDGQVVRVLEQANVDGYEDIKDRDYDSVRDMAKRTNMPPYQRY